MKRLLLFLLFAIIAAAQNTAKFPTAVATNQDLAVATDAPNRSTLARDVDASTLAIPVADGTKFRQYNIITFTDSSEQAMICSISGNTLTLCARGFASTTPASHLSGIGLIGSPTAWHHNQLAAEVISIETTLGANLSNLSGLGAWSKSGTSVYYTGGNVMVGTSTDGGQKFQVSGNGYFSGTVTAPQFAGNASTVTNGVYTSGSYSDPSWLTITKSKVGLGSVENTALSTWAGSANITSIGNLATHLKFGTDNTYDIGASGANRPRTIYIGTGLKFPDGTTQTTAATSQWVNGTSGVIYYGGGKVGIGYGITSPSSAVQVEVNGNIKSGYNGTPGLQTQIGQLSGMGQPGIAFNADIAATTNLWTNTMAQRGSGMGAALLDFAILCV